MPKRTLRRLLSDPAARGAFFLYGGAAFHFLYAIFRLFSGAFFSPLRLDTAALFYLSLGVSRLFLIAAYRKKGDARAAKRALRRVGGLFFCTAGLVLLRLADIVSDDGRASFRGTVVVSGGYALVSAVLAILELWYYKRLTSPILSASRAVGLSAALLSAYTFLSDVLLAHPAMLARTRLLLLIVLGAVIVFLHLFFALGFFTYGKRKRHLL